MSVPNRASVPRRTDEPEGGPASAGRRAPDADAAPRVPALLERGASAGAPVVPAGILSMQRAAGNIAVAGAFAAARSAGTPSAPPQSASGRGAVVQRDAPAPPTGTPGADAGSGATAGAGTAPAPDGPTVPGGSGTMAAPPRTQAVSTGDGNAVGPEGQLSADANSVTLTVVAHNFNVHSGRVLDILHEPGISIQVSPGSAPQPVIQAAIAALDAHIRSHGDDLVEISLSPQVQAGPGGVTASVQAQAEIHITASFSMTVSSTISATGAGGTPDPSQVRVGSAGGVDLLWQPISIGTLFHLDSGSPERPQGGQIDYDALRADAKVISWVAGQLSPADFRSRASGDLDDQTMVTQLYDVMRGATGDAVDWVMHGMPPADQLPAGLASGLRRAAQLLAQANPALAHVRMVRVSVMAFDPQGAEHVVRLIPLSL